MLKVNIRTDRFGHWLEAPRAWRGEFDNHRGTASRGIGTSMFRSRMENRVRDRGEMMSRTGSPAAT